MLLPNHDFKPRLQYNPVYDKHEIFDDVFLHDNSLTDKPETGCFSSFSNFFNFIMGFLDRRN
jgi:hypothetical protein